MHIKQKWRKHSVVAKVESATQYGDTKLHEKKTIQYKEQDQKKMKAYLEQIKDIPSEKIAYVDKSGIDNLPISCITTLPVAENRNLAKSFYL